MAMCMYRNLQTLTQHALKGNAFFFNQRFVHIIKKTRSKQYKTLNLYNTTNITSSKKA